MAHHTMSISNNQVKDLTIVRKVIRCSDRHLQSGNDHVDGGTLPVVGATRSAVMSAIRSATDAGAATVGCCCSTIGHATWLDWALVGRIDPGSGRPARMRSIS